MILLYITFIYLRFARKDLKRPYRVPLNNYLVIIMCLFPVGISIYNLISSEPTSKIAAVIAVSISLFSYPIMCWKEFKGFWLGLRDKFRNWRSGRDAGKTTSSNDETITLADNRM